MGVYIDGPVISPGLYPFTAVGSIESLIQVAGGTTTNASLGSSR